MLQIQYLDKLSDKERKFLFNRFGNDFISIMNNIVAPIVSDVKKNGEKAVIKYTEKFDQVKLQKILASPAELINGYKNTAPEIIEAFNQAKENITEFHSQQSKKNIQYKKEDDTILGLMYQPIENAGIYVPGGKAAYPSSVLMGVIPAQLAGVKNITIITPPGPDGKILNSICAICHILGVKNVLKSGGAQGIAAAGLGTETVQKSDIIVGPGNIFVTAAKSYLFSLGLIQIDSLAGPSEVLIIADEEANAKHIAWDMLSQAEHDERAMAVLVTTSEKLANKVNIEIDKDLNDKCGRFQIKETAIKNNGKIIITKTLDEAINFSNNFAPEHMEFMVKNPMKYLEKIKNVGSLFLGYYAPVAVGDYFSGTNHILPTGGATRFSSGLSVETFYKRMTYQYLTREGLKKSQNAVNIMSKAEGFDDKHGGSINVRFEQK